MKAVLMSIKPEWVDKIIKGEKTIEVRKNAPKIETPFKVYIYETKGKTELPWVDEDGHYIYEGRGQVIGEFICDKITKYDFILPYDGEDFKHALPQCDLEKTCLEDYELDEYIGNKAGYGWHISDIKVYDEPKELYNFHLYEYKRCEEYKKEFCTLSTAMERCRFIKCSSKWITRPPQSWQYVEELE